MPVRSGQFHHGGMIRLLLARHGETEQNATGILQGQGLGTLSAKGWQQIERLAERLKGEQIDYILSSDLARAKHTTEAIARHHQCPIEFLPILRERSFGVFEGRHVSEYHDARVKSGEEADSYRPERGESMNDFLERCEKILELVFQYPDNVTILLSTHNGVIKGIIRQLDKHRIKDFHVAKLGNTSVSEFVLDKNRNIHSSYVNCTAHLEGLAS